MKNILYIIIVAFIMVSCADKSKGVPTQSVQKTGTEKEHRLVGSYITANTDAGAHCLLKITRLPNGTGYAYRLTTDERMKEGKLTYTHDATTNEDFVMLEGIHWDEYEGDVSREDEDSPAEKEPLESPIGISGTVTGDTITIQNYGNAMNSYTKLAEVSDKYIVLVKQ